MLIKYMINIVNIYNNTDN